MCKCCQSLWESCYWHCCEKHFCWDDSIALYEDPDEKKSEQNNNGLDNMAFYDNVALIANRSIFTIEPLPHRKDPVPVVVQPKKKLRWFEDEDEQNVVNERRSTMRGRKMSTVPEEDHDAISVDTIDGNHQETDKEKTQENVEEKPVGETQESTRNNRKETTVVSVEVNKADEEVVELRRKKLQERRIPKGLTLMINRPELPVIRHNSMPKFYLDTPEENQIHYTGIRTPSITLTAPIKPKEFEFDLKSVVQIQKEVTPPTENVKPKRTQSVRERILKRQSSNLSINAASLASIHM